MPKRIKPRKKSKRKIKRQKKKNKRHLLSVIHGSWLKVLVAFSLKRGPWTWRIVLIFKKSFMPGSWYPFSKIKMPLTYKSSRRFIELIDIKTIHAHWVKLKVFIKRLIGDIWYDCLVLPTITAQISFLSKWKFHIFFSFYIDFKIFFS